MSADSAESGSGKVLLLLIGALLVLRAALVLALGDVFFYGDELEKGAAAKAMLDGLGTEVGHHRLAYHYYEGGGYVVSHLDALAFLLVGENLLALKLVALAFNVAILWAGFALALRAFGGRAALLFGLFFVLAPESVQKNSLLTLGIHWQALPFALFALDRGGRIVVDGDGSRSNWLVLGLAAGFGTYFNYGVAPLAAFVGLAILVRRARLLFSRPALWGLIGLVVGLAPLAWMASKVGGDVLDIHGASLAGGAAPWSRVGDFLGSVYGGRSALDLIAVLFVAAAPVAGLFALLATGGSGRRWGLFLAGALVTFLLAYLFSSFVVGSVHHYFLFHRLSQPWLLATLLAAGGLAALDARGGGTRATAALLVAGTVFVGARGAFDVVARGNTVDLGRNFGVLTGTKGYRWDHYVDKVWGHLEGDGPAKVAALRRIEDPDPELLEHTLAVNLFGPSGMSLAEVRHEVAGLGFEHPDEAILALGALWRERYPGLELHRRRAAVLGNEQLDEATRPLVEESFGRFGLGFQVRFDRVRAELAEGLEYRFPPAYFRGLGYRLYSAMGDAELSGYWRQTLGPCFVNPDRGLAFIGAQDPALAGPMLEGFERAVSEHSLP